MGKGEIKLRKKSLDPLEILRHRDYSAIVVRHRKKERKRKLIRFLGFSVAVTLIVIILLLLISWIWFGMEHKSAGTAGSPPKQFARGPFPKQP